MKTKFEKYCKEYITDSLNDFLGTEVYLCDLGYKITESASVNGSITYSTYEAKEFIKEYFDEAGAYYEYSKDNFGEVQWNPFDNPEAYMVCMVIQGVDTLLNNILGDRDDWSDKVEITKKLIKTIEKGLKDAEIDWL